jgi:hypothetical protein
MQSVRLHARIGVLAVSVYVACLSIAKAEEIHVPMKAFNLSDVRLLDGQCRDEQEATRRYLHELDPERLLYTFRKNAGLDAPGEPLGGWEKPDSEVRGHFIGHYVSACAEMYAATGDEELKARADYMVAEMAKCQEALGGEYLSAYPESFFDRLEAMERVPWAAYYTIHKIMSGLYDAHTLCGNEQALDVLKGMSAYFKKRMDKLTTWQIDRLLTVEFGGMSEVLHNLYAVTKSPDDLALAHTFDQASFLGPLALSHDNLTRIHGNTHIPIVMGAARHYELTGDARYRDPHVRHWRQHVVGTLGQREPACPNARGAQSRMLQDAEHDVPDAVSLPMDRRSEVPRFLRARVLQWSIGHCRCGYGTNDVLRPDGDRVYQTVWNSQRHVLVLLRNRRRSASATGRQHLLPRRRGPLCELVRGILTCVEG